MNAKNLAAEEENFKKAMSFLPTPEEETQGASEKETRLRSLQDEQDLTVTKPDPNICHYANLDGIEVNVESQPSGTEPSVRPTCRLNAATSKESTAGYMGENESRGCTEAPSSLEQAEQTNFSSKNVEYKLSIDSGGLHENPASSPPLDSCSDFLGNGNLNNSAASPVSPTGNAVGLKNNALDNESEPPGTCTIRGLNETSRILEESFADFSKRQLPNQGSGVAAVVSLDLDGWQRFDSEENEGNVAFGSSSYLHKVGCDQAIGRKLLKKGELWEQLLEEDSEDSDTHLRSPILKVEAEIGVDNGSYVGNQFWFASPGNPFIEGQDRLSNFSEVDHYTANDLGAHSQLLQAFEENKGLPFKEDPFHADHLGGNCSQEKLVEGKGSQSNGLYNHGGNRPSKPRFPSFSDLQRPLSRSKDSSFASFLDQVPAFQAGNYVHDIENVGETWQADFDSMVPPAQEGPRSVSLPREAGDTIRQRQKQMFSFFSRAGPARFGSKPSGICSPKPSSGVKGFTNKVPTKPRKVANALHNGKTPSTVDKEPKKRIWRCCICCSRGS